jgi:hypothetical protein
MQVDDPKQVGYCMECGMYGVLPPLGIYNDPVKPKPTNVRDAWDIETHLAGGKGRHRTIAPDGERGHGLSVVCNGVCVGGR